jgi:hypothetical protein
MTETGWRITTEVAPREEARGLANALHRALAQNDDALVMGSVESGVTLIDGNFDLIDLASKVIADLSAQPPQNTAR